MRLSHWSVPLDLENYDTYGIGRSFTDIKRKISTPKWVSDRSNHIPTERRNIGMVFQDFALFPHLSVVQNIGFKIKNVEKIAHWLQLLELNDVKDKSQQNCLEDKSNVWPSHEL